MKAVICPVCSGSGKYHPRDSMEIECHGCEGLGWVRVPEYYYTPYYSPPTWPNPYEITWICTVQTA